MKLDRNDLKGKTLSWALEQGIVGLWNKGLIPRLRYCSITSI